MNREELSQSFYQLEAIEQRLIKIREESLVKIEQMLHDAQEKKALIMQALDGKRC
jgi:hypothetical protein